MCECSHFYFALLGKFHIFAEGTFDWRRDALPYNLIFCVISNVNEKVGFVNLPHLFYVFVVGLLLAPKPNERKRQSYRVLARAVVFCCPKCSPKSWGAKEQQKKGKQCEGKPLFTQVGGKSGFLHFLAVFVFVLSFFCCYFVAQSEASNKSNKT